jgi:hypothetical protein
MCRLFTSSAAIMRVIFFAGKNVFVLPCIVFNAFLAIYMCKIRQYALCLSSPDLTIFLVMFFYKLASQLSSYCSAVHVPRFENLKFTKFVCLWWRHFRLFHDCTAFWWFWNWLSVKNYIGECLISLRLVFDTSVPGFLPFMLVFSVFSVATANQLVLPWWRSVCGDE